MADSVVIRGSGGVIDRASISFNTTEFAEHVEKELLDRLELICDMVRTQAVRNVSVSSRSKGPSHEGEFPHADTGRLRNSIFWDVDRRAFRGIVGTPLLYGLYLEYGHAGSRGERVFPKNARAFSWIDKATGERVFYASIIIKPQRPRSYLRRTLVEMKPTIQRIMDRPLADMPKSLKTQLGDGGGRKWKNQYGSGGY